MAALAENEEFDLLVDDEGMFTVDEEGNAVDPAAEGSFLMAEGFPDNGEQIVPFVPDFDGEKMKRESLAFFAQRSFDTNATSSAHVDEYLQLTDATEDEKKPADEYSEGAIYEEDEEDYFPEMGSRDMTDPDDWVLEAILRRKMNKEREGGPWVYLCKWKRHEEPTWETREVMEEAGWIPQLDAFDARGIHKSTRQPSKNAQRQTHQYYSDLIESFFGGESCIQRAITKSGCEVHHYCKMNPKLALRFCEAWERKKETHAPIIIFHGTRAVNLPSIYTNGLIVGGTKGVPIANGSVHGRGVYTARSPVTPKSYGRTSSSLIVCAGLVPVTSIGASGEVFQRGGYIIFGNSAYVFPMWLVQFDGSAEYLCGSPTLLAPQDFFCNAHHGFGRYPKSNLTDATTGRQIQHSTVLDESESRQLQRAMMRLQGSNGGFKKSALKAQPRKIKELLAKMQSQ